MRARPTARQNGPSSRIGEGGKRVVEGLRLADGAREAVEDGAGIGRRTGKLLHEHRDGELVRDELAALHVLAGGFAERRAGRERRTEQVSGCEVNEAQLPRQDRRLRPLAGTDGTDEKEDQPIARVAGRCVGHLMKPS